MKGNIRKKGKTWSYRVYVSTVDVQNKQIEKGGFKTLKCVFDYAYRKRYMATGIKETSSQSDLNEIKKTILR